MNAYQMYYAKMPQIGPPARKGIGSDDYGPCRTSVWGLQFAVCNSPGRTLVRTLGVANNE